MYADSITPAMAQAIDETNRRRAKQIAYNTERGIDPQPLRKKIADITDLITKEAEDTEAMTAGTKKRSAVISAGLEAQISAAHSLPRQELIALIESLTEQMKAAAAELAFELAGRLRDEIRDLKKELRGMEEAGT
jgi:excinuclease ABC subunit B